MFAGGGAGTGPESLPRVLGPGVGPPLRDQERRRLPCVGRESRHTGVLSPTPRRDRKRHSRCDRLTVLSFAEGLPFLSVPPPTAPPCSPRPGSPTSVENRFLLGGGSVGDQSRPRGCGQGSPGAGVHGPSETLQVVSVPHEVHGATRSSASCLPSRPERTGHYYHPSREGTLVGSLRPVEMGGPP